MQGRGAPAEKPGSLAIAIDEAQELREYSLSLPGRIFPLPSPFHSSQ